MRPPTRRRAAHQHAGKPRFRMGDSDQRRTDDRAPHRSHRYKSASFGLRQEESMAANRRNRQQDKWEVAWRGIHAGDVAASRRTCATSSSATTRRTRATAPSWQGPTERTRGMWQKLQPLLAKEREKGILDVSQVPVRHPRARAGLHRQGQRDHRRPADRRAAQARDHAVRRLARGRGQPQVVRLQARRASSAKFSRSIARRTTTACSTRTRRTSGRRGRRASSPDCRMRTAAAASSATIAAWRFTASIS